MTLYDLTTDDLRLQQWMMEEGSEEDQALQDTYEMIKADFADKANDYGKVSQNLRANAALKRAAAEQLMNEAKRLKADADMITRNADRMDKALMEALIMTGRVNRSGNPEWKTDLFTFGVRKSSSVVVDPETDLTKVEPALVKVKIEPDKTAIKDYLKLGGELPWAHIETRQSLSIR